MLVLIKTIHFIFIFDTTVFLQGPNTSVVISSGNQTRRWNRVNGRISYWTAEGPTVPSVLR